MLNQLKFTNSNVHVNCMIACFTKDYLISGFHFFEESQQLCEHVLKERNDAA